MAIEILYRGWFREKNLSTLDIPIKQPVPEQYFTLE